MSSVDERLTQEERLALLKGFVLKKVTGSDITEEYKSYINESLRSQNRDFYGVREGAAQTAKRTRKSKRKKSSGKQKLRRRSSRTRRRSR